MKITKTNLHQTVSEIYTGNVEAGWYSDPKTGERIQRNIPEMMMLMVSEISEAMEGVRKNLSDDKLPHRTMVVAELADVFIRWADLVGYLESLGYVDALEIDEVIYEKREYNANRADHKIENRAAAGGKQF
jgi:hypothetical protein